MIRFLPAAALVVLVSSAAPAQTMPKNILEAFPIAQAEVPNGQLLQARVENKTSGKVYGFYFRLNGQVLEVEIFPSGKVAKKTEIEPTKGRKPGGEEKDDPAIDPAVVALLTKQKEAKAKLPDGRLLELAVAASGDTPFGEMKYEIRDGRLVIVVGTTVIDAETGRVVSN